ncbi:hypothetical protein [Nonomuraea sp. NEAU-A123]|uniref:hypothetical protein n=1 Tax=Nonomuraea sp. NEAU-A123 TaxID=2839649 RepID=UPI001BE46B79|nr:hypothetical protein [Nonomuraea sp. NEAU-A123]MBT2227237.1 hypothetical protein [Nonomuraea sp. NEAU-A123]
MSEVVPLPSFGEVFFDARGQERCLRVTWHEGTLVLSLWRGEMCTASFRMPMDDVGRLLDTLDDGFAEATGEQPAVPAHDPGTEVIPGTGQYQRPRQSSPPPPHEDRPTAALSPNDVLVARGTPPPPDKLVASYGETTGSRDPHGQQYGERSSFGGAPQYGQPNPREPFTGPQYTEPEPPEPFTGPQYAVPGAPEPYSGPQYTGDPFTGPQQYAQPAPVQDPGEPVYQMPGDRRRQAPTSTDPLGFPSQTAAPNRQQPDPFTQQPAHDLYGNRGYQPQQPPAPALPDPSAAGLGTPMHGIPGAGRRQEPITYRDTYQQVPYPSTDGFPAYQTPPNPVDPLFSMGAGQQQAQPYQTDMSRPYVGDPMFSTGERLRPDQEFDDDRDRRREW